MGNIPGRNIPPDNGQAQSKSVFTLNSSGVATVLIDSLTSVAGAAGGETTIFLAPSIGVQIIFVVNAANLATLPIGSSLWLWNLTTNEHERVTIQSVDTGGINETVTFNERLRYKYEIGDIVSVTSPFDDVFRVDICGSAAGGTRIGGLIFCDATPAAAVYADLFGSPPAFPVKHFESFKVIPVISDMCGEYDIPLSAVPCRFIAAVSAGTWDGPAGGNNDNFGITLYHKRSVTGRIGTI